MYIKRTYTLSVEMKDIEEVMSEIEPDIAKCFDSPTAKKISVGLYEILVNAVEHGNLGITYAEKQEALKNNRYDRLLRERHDNKEYSKRKASVVFELTDEKAEFTVEDEGEGFNYKDKHFSDLFSSSDNVYRENGRGIFIASCYFDEVSYNEKGNGVTLVKYIDK